MTHAVPHRRARRLPAVAVGLAALLLGAPAVATAAPAPAAPERGADAGAVERVRWSPCADSPPGSPALDCATYEVPLDYEHPDRGTVRLALDRFRATGPDRIGSLFINPGGPGGSGVELVADLAPTPLLSNLARRFDIIGMDPRGIARSTPSIRCEPVARTLARADAARAHPVDLQAGLRNGREFAESCQRESGDLLPYMGSEYVARDLDRVRAAVGDATLTYLGLSYGTYLGAVYADLFPSRVRAVVLDGSLDPFAYGQDFLGLLSTNYRASQSSVEAFVSWCSRNAQQCGFGGGDARTALRGLLQHLDAHPLVSGAGGGRTVTNGYTVAELLYVQTTGGREAWPETGQILAALAAGKQVLSNRDLVNAGTAANVVVECTDAAGGQDARTFRSFARRAPDLAPTFGPALVSGPPTGDGANGAACAQWPVEHPPSDWQGDFRAQGSDPVLVVGSVGDPSTPYSGAVALAATLDHGRLLTERSGPDSTHTSYFFNSCIRARVDAYLLRQVLPPVGASCAEEEPPLGARSLLAGLVR